MLCGFAVVKRNDMSPTSYFSSVAFTADRSTCSPSAIEGTSTVVVPTFFSRTVALKSLPISSFAGVVSTIVSSRSLFFVGSAFARSLLVIMERGLSQVSGTAMCSEGTRQPEVRSREATSCARLGTAATPKTNTIPAAAMLINLLGISRKFTTFPLRRAVDGVSRPVRSAEEMRVSNWFDADFDEGPIVFAGDTDESQKRDYKSRNRNQAKPHSILSASKIFCYPRRAAS